MYVLYSCLHKKLFRLTSTVAVVENSEAHYSGKEINPNYGSREGRHCITKCACPKAIK